MIGGDVAFAVILYMLCSGFMLIANKVTIFMMPAPACVFALQLVVAVSVVATLGKTRLIEVDGFTADNVRTFMPYIFAFALSVYSNGKALEEANVDTVIVFRSCTPLFVSVLDWLFLGRELPSLRNSLVLGGVLVGAIGYVYSDGDFQLYGFTAYGWVTVYVFAIVFEMTYGKKLLAKVKFQSPVWGSVMYTNALGLPPMIGLAIVSGEMDAFRQMEIGHSGALALLGSSAIGVGIGWAGWNARDKVSATTYTLVGVSCKFISVLVNICIWDKHASTAGILWLFVCLGFGSLYRQAPMRDDHEPRSSIDLPKAGHEKSVYSKIGAPAGHDLEGDEELQEPNGRGGRSS